MNLDKLRLWIIKKAWPRRYSRWTSTGNRTIREWHIGELAVTLECRDLSSTQEGWRSREELYSMLRMIRQNESRMGWKVPEPDDPPVPLGPQFLLCLSCGFVGDGHRPNCKLYTSKPISPAVEQAAKAQDDSSKPYSCTSSGYGPTRYFIDTGSGLHETTLQEYVAWNEHVARMDVIKRQAEPVR